MGGQVILGGWNKGLRMSPECCEKMSRSRKGKILSEEHKAAMRTPHFGEARWPHTKEWNEKISKALKGRKHPQTEEWSKNISQAKKGKPLSPEHAEKFRLCKVGRAPWNKGLRKIKGKQLILKPRIFTPEHRKNMRIARLRVVAEQLKKGTQVSPAYNPRACEFFEFLDRSLQTSGRYATNGKEYFIKKLGYFLDYFNLNLKLIIEWDERRHYTNKRLRPRDAQRQAEIQNLFPDFTIIRLRERKN